MLGSLSCLVLSRAELFLMLLFSSLTRLGLTCRSLSRLALSHACGSLPHHYLITCLALSELSGRHGQRCAPLCFCPEERTTTCSNWLTGCAFKGPSNVLASIQGFSSWSPQNPSKTEERAKRTGGPAIQLPSSLLKPVGPQTSHMPWRQDLQDTVQGYR